MALTKNPSIVQTIDTSNGGHVLPQHEIYNTNSTSSKQSIVPGGQVPPQRRTQRGNGTSFPMSSGEFLQFNSNKLSQYERDEVQDYDTVYYANCNMKNKGIGQYVRGELTCQDEDPKEEPADGIYNHGFDNDQADYIYEQKD